MVAKFLIILSAIEVDSITERVVLKAEEGSRKSMENRLRTKVAMYNPARIVAELARSMIHDFHSA